MTTIKKGYRLTVTSWENDSDNHWTISHEGYTQEEMAFLVDFVQLFYSKNDYKGREGFGNMYDPHQCEWEGLVAAFTKLVKKHGVTVLNTLEYEVTQEEMSDENTSSDLVSELHGKFFGYGDFTTRVLDTFIVEYIPMDVELKDVTAQFVKV
jgi:hypothetical protein